jgi:hypothetical protein
VGSGGMIAAGTDSPCHTAIFAGSYFATSRDCVVVGCRMAATMADTAQLTSTWPACALPVQDNPPKLENPCRFFRSEHDLPRVWGRELRVARHCIAMAALDFCAHLYIH